MGITPRKTAGQQWYSARPGRCRILRLSPTAVCRLLEPQTDPSKQVFSPWSPGRDHYRATLAPAGPDRAEHRAWIAAGLVLKGRQGWHADPDRAAQEGAPRAARPADQLQWPGSGQPWRVHEGHPSGQDRCRTRGSENRQALGGDSTSVSPLVLYRSILRCPPRSAGERTGSRRAPDRQRRHRC